MSTRFKEKSYGSSGATSGLTSSLAFTPVQVCLLVTIVVADIFQHIFVLGHTVVS